MRRSRVWAGIPISDNVSAIGLIKRGKPCSYDFVLTLSRSYRMYADFGIRDVASDADPVTRNKKYAEAFQWAEKSHMIAKRASTASPWVSAALFYMGRIRVLQGKLIEAK